MIIIPDIHGTKEFLDLVLDKFPEENFIFLGDLTDRGRDNVYVVEKFEELCASGRAEGVCGNHDAMFIDAMKEYSSQQDITFWLNNGGSSVVREVSEYCGTTELLRKELRRISSILQNRMKEYIIHTNSKGEKFLIAHADLPVLLSGTVIGEYHLWNRPDKSKSVLSSFPDVDFSIHGHSVLKFPKTEYEDSFEMNQKKYFVPKNKIYLDTGAVFTDKYCVYDTETHCYHLFHNGSWSIYA